MPSLDAPAQRAPRPQAVTLDARTLCAGLVAIAAGIAVHRDAALNQRLFHAVNALGPQAPVAWSCLTVAGLGLAAVGLFALGIALSRIAVGAHWPADVLVGSGLGLVFGSLAPHAWPVAALARGLARPAGRRAWALVLLGCGLWIGATPSLLHAIGVGDGAPLARRVATGSPLGEPLQFVLALAAFAGAWRWWRRAGDAA